MSITQIFYTSAGLNTNIESGLRSLVVCCVPGRSQRKFHALLHTENVSFILPTEGERKAKSSERVDQMEKKTQSLNVDGLLGGGRCD